MAREFMQIVGADGTFMSEPEGQLMLIVSGIESGALPSEMYHTGLSLANSLAGIRPASPVLARFRNLPNIMRISPPSAATRVAIAPAAPQVQSVTPGELREVVQGLDTGSTLIAAGATFVLTFNASMLFRPTRMMVGPSVAPFWTVDDIRVAADSLFLSSGPVPAEVYLPDGVGASALKRRTAQPGTPVQVQVTNIDVAPHRFRGAIFGAAADASSCAV